MTKWQKAAYHWDVYPKFVQEDKPVTVTVKPIGKQSAFPAGDLRVRVQGLQERVYPQDDTPRNNAEYVLHAEKDGSLKVTHTFHGEQEFYLLVYVDETEYCRASVYCIKEDLVGLIPLMGDQHIHTMRSDGGYDPAYVAAFFRSKGMDYISITDHHNMIGCLEAIDDYAGVPLDLNIIPGEEVHMPDANIHVVNFGSRRSVNAMTEDNIRYMTEKNDPEISARHAEVWQKSDLFPGTVTEDAFKDMIRAYAETLEIPEGLPKYVYACYKWVCNEIRKAGGLAIFAHPYWIAGTSYHVDERLTDYIMEQRDFDAYEVLGGELYFEQNGHQVVDYYRELAKGRQIPIVGSSDTHRIVENPGASCASTVVFAKSNKVEDIHAAIRAGLAVAVDWISPNEPRLVGDFRLVKIVQFLMNTYFPVHNAICEAESTAMLEYAFGDRESGKKNLEASYGRIPALWRKYFSVK